MPWYVTVLLAIPAGMVGGWLMRRVPDVARWWSKRARQRRAARKWRAYAAKIGKRVEDLTPREKLEAHGLPRDGERHDGR